MSPANPGEVKLWTDLKACEPDDVCRRALCEWAQDKGAYSIRVMLRDYEIFPAEEKIVFADSGELAKTGDRIFILSYLVNAKEIPPAGKFVTPLGLKSGPIFFRGPHNIWVEPIIDKYGRDPEGFARRGEELGAEQYPFGDAGFKFDLFPRVPAAYVLRKGDEEFPPEVTVLFDRGVEEHLPMDMVWGAIFFMTKIIAG